MITDGRNIKASGSRAMTMVRLRFHAEVERRVSASGARSLLVAVSGGADSVALLLALTRIAPRLGLRLEAANCNFRLRGEESDRDSRFVEDLCHRIGVKLHSFCYDTPSLLEKKPRVSMETLCRNLRYADFYRVIKDEGLERIAVAHNADDDAETMLMFLMRGAGTRGLKGMDFDNGKVIRPLLGIPRSAIEEYLTAEDQDFATDSTNLTSDYRRNFLRREVIPLLETRWPGARKSISRSISVLKEESEIIRRHYDEIVAELITPTGDLLTGDPRLTVGVIWHYLAPIGGNTSMAEEIHEAIGKPFAQRIWKIDDIFTVILERDRIRVETQDESPDEPELKWERLELTEALWKEIRGSRNHNEAYLPKGPEAYELRAPHTGDRMEPLGMKGSRLVSDIISDARLNSEAKARVRVLVRLSDGKIVWIPGLKRSRHDLLSETSGECYRCVAKT